MHWQGIHRQAMNWVEEIQWYETVCKGKGSVATNFRMVLADSVYDLWLERNHRVFRNTPHCEDAIVRKITQEIYVRSSIHGKLVGI